MTTPVVSSEFSTSNQTIPGTTKASPMQAVTKRAPVEVKNISPKCSFKLVTVIEPSSKIFNSSFCKTAAGINSSIQIYVRSYPREYSLRTSIRTSWGRAARKFGILVLFVMGLAADRSDDNETDWYLEKEGKVYQDIIQWGFNDTYKSGSIRTAMLSAWITNKRSRCNASLKHITMLTDHDILLSPQNLLRFLGEQKFEEKQKTLAGCLWKHVFRQRKLRSKWYIPNSVWPAKLYPKMLPGFAAIYSHDAPQDMHKFACGKSYKFLQEFFVDDVLFNGVFPKEFGYLLQDTKRINPDRKKCEDPCIAVHAHARTDATHETCTLQVLLGKTNWTNIRTI